jgi:PAN domain
MADEQKPRTALNAVAGALLLALVAGTSAPWWWNLIRPEPQVNASNSVANGPAASNSLEPTKTPAAGEIGALETAKVSPADDTGAPEAPKHSLRHEMGALEFDTNRQGHDLNTGDEVRRAEDCSQLCAQEERCRAMTFVQHPSGSGGICWLKDGGSDPLPRKGMISAPKVLVTN